MTRGCILFSQYYDTVRWVGDELAKRPEFAGLEIGLYAGSNRSGIWSAGRFQRCDRELLKARVRAGELKILLGTDAASEGLNLQRLGTLINIDLPWNPTRWSSAKGASSASGQVRSEVWIATSYRGSVEDWVHQVLADRLESSTPAVRADPGHAGRCGSRLRSRASKGTAAHRPYDCHSQPL
jgi:hypothetical protein